MSPPECHDVVVIGAGVVGAAIARELSRHELDVLVLEAGPDVGTGTSKANTAIWHTGFDASPGSLEASLLRRAYPLFEEYAAASGLALERTGALLVAWTPEEVEQLPHIQANAAANGVTDLVPLSGDQVRELEPELGPGTLAGLLIPGEGIVCPYSPPLAFAYEAVRNGAQLRLDSPVTGVTRENGVTRLTTRHREHRARHVINAAGLHCDEIDRLFGHDRIRVRPRKGELIVFDKGARALLQRVILPVPTRTTKGVLVAPTVFGNLLLGPTAEDQDDRTDRSTSGPALEGLLAKGARLLPRLAGFEVTASYAGLRAATQHKDYVIELDADGRYLLVGSIRSTGLSAALGIAAHVKDRLADAGLEMRPRASPARPWAPYLGTDRARSPRAAASVARRPDYGHIVCHCEEVSVGEVLDALEAPVPARDLDGLRRRTRCLQGRCQGFYCLANLVEMVAAYQAAEPEEILGCREIRR